MKRFILIMALVSLTMVLACSSLTMENVKDIALLNKMYYVIFEEKPELATQEVYASGLEIGKISSQKPSADGMVVAKISVENEHADLIRENVVFYVSEGKLTLDTVGENGNPLSEGAKILGFTGKTSLVWFKTKNKVKNISNAAVNKAQELYDRAVVK